MGDFKTFMAALICVFAGMSFAFSLSYSKITRLEEESLRYKTNWHDTWDAMQNCFERNKSN